MLYRHFPMPNHRFAVPAARASECAGDQGRFPEMHRALFENADSLGLAPWWWFASLAGVTDSSGFAECVRSSSPLLALERDVREGRRLGVEGTPTLLVGAWRVNGVPPLDTLRAYIKRATEEAKNAPR